MDRESVRAHGRLLAASVVAAAGLVAAVSWLDGTAGARSLVRIVAGEWRLLVGIALGVYATSAVSASVLEASADTTNGFRGDRNGSRESGRNRRRRRR